MLESLTQFLNNGTAQAEALNATVNGICNGVEAAAEYLPSAPTLLFAAVIGNLCIAAAVGIRNQGLLPLPEPVVTHPDSPRPPR